MNLKFENRYFASDEMLSEYVRKVLCKNVTSFGVIVFVWALIMLMITLYDRDYTYAAIFGTSLFILFPVILLTPFLTLRQLKESSRRIHNGKKYESIIQFGDKITLLEGTFSLTLEYAQILKIYALKHSYILMFGKSNAILLRRDGFTIGSFEEFVPFIQSTCRLKK